MEGSSMGRDARFHWRRNSLGYYLPAGIIGYEVWKTLVWEVGKEHSASLWQIADLARYAEATYPDEGSKYDVVAAATGRRVKYLRNLAYIAGAVPLSRRRDALKFAHHAEVAALAAADQEQLLQLAVDAGLTRSELRKQVLKRKKVTVKTGEQSKENRRSAAASAHQKKAYGTTGQGYDDQVDRIAQKLWISLDPSIVAELLEEIDRIDFSDRVPVFVAIIDELRRMVARSSSEESENGATEEQLTSGATKVPATVH
jgi:hypothetical protein